MSGAAIESPNALYLRGSRRVKNRTEPYNLWYRRLLRNPKPS
jgi:hypothetical protein